MDVHQRENGKWCYIGKKNIGHKYTPMSEWVGQFDTRQEAVLAARAEATEADAFKLGSRLAEWIDRAHNAEAEVARLRAELEAAKADATEWEALWRQDAAGG